MILQQLWQLQLDWDQRVPNSFLNQWTRFQPELACLNSLEITRHVIFVNPELIEIHCFSDASEKAYASCIYLRSINAAGLITVQLLCAKTKVAPLKSLTIPRLKLCAAYLSAKLFHVVREALQLKFKNVFMWCDSTIVLGWLKIPPNLLKVFVSHRVSEIQEITFCATWSHVPSQENPADLASRGVFPGSLKSSQLWWHGPCWLSLLNDQWPKREESQQEIHLLPELKRIELTFLAINNESLLKYDKFSTI